MNINGRQLNQLKMSIALVKDALLKINSGDKKYYLVLGTQLRALLCTGGRNFHPLLIETAEAVNFPLACYGPRDKDPKNEIWKGLKFNIHGKEIGVVPYSPIQIKYNLRNWLESHVLVVDGYFHTPNLIIRAYADKESSHFDSLPDTELEKVKKIIFTSTDGRQQNEVERFLVLTGEYVDAIGTNFISSLTNDLESNPNARIIEQ